MSEASAPTQRVLHVIAVAAAGVAGIGFFAGTRPLPPLLPPLETGERLAPGGLAPAPTYAELAQ